MTRKAKIVLTFSCSGLLFGAINAACAFLIDRPWDRVDYLLLVLCPPSLGAMMIHSDREAIVIWGMIVAENAALYAVAGLGFAHLLRTK